VENITSYIDSGVLEQYVLDELSPAERTAVEAAAQQEPAVRQQLNELTAGLDLYTQAHAQTQPAGMRDRVLGGALAQIRAQSIAAAPAAQESASAASPLRVSPREDATVAATPAATAAEMTPVRAMYAAETAPRSSRWAMAASVALLLSLAGNVLLYSRWQRSHADLVAMQTEQASFASTSQVVSRELAQTRQQVAVLRNDEFRAVALAGTKTAPSARARVLYNPATKAVYLDVRSLPALPEGKQYQLWALDKGQPVDAGMLAATTAAGQGLQQMKNIVSAQAFAMTVEPVGGSKNPTLSTMTVMGAVGS
jgi:hypothetical protein